jgi:hypothetical protein
MNYNIINKINGMIDKLQDAYHAEDTKVVDFMYQLQDTRDDIIRAFKNNKIDINYYLLYSNSLSEFSLNNRFRGA